MTNQFDQKIVTRFAPSPTGFLHIGSIRTALFSFLYARKNSGTFILRLEDTDQKRTVEGAIEHIIESLDWLGLGFDYGPGKEGSFGSCVQSERLPIYKNWAEKLIERGLAYPDPYSAEELETFRQAAQKNNQPFLYRDHRPDTFDTWHGSRPLRLKVPELKRYVWQDAVRGELSAGPEMLDDIILIKADGYPTYNFAHIVDDIEMGVTHVMRGDEFISSTPKFLSIYEALKIAPPVFVTLPPILREDRTKKLGKRDGAKDVLGYRDEGFLSSAMINWLALIGWNPGNDQEIFTLEELIEAFSLAKIQRGGGAANEEKLLWFNKKHLEKLSDREYLEYVKEGMPEAWSNAAVLDRLLPILRERAHNREEVIESFQSGEYDFAYSEPDVSFELLKWKKDPDLKVVLPRLEAIQNLLKDADFSSVEAIKAVLMDYADKEGRGEVLWPLRVALTGKERSPDPFSVAYILGKAQTLARLNKVCAKIETNGA